MPDLGALPGLPDATAAYLSLTDLKEIVTLTSWPLVLAAVAGGIALLCRRDARSRRPAGLARRNGRLPESHGSQGNRDADLVAVGPGRRGGRNRIAVPARCPISAPCRACQTQRPPT